MDLLGKSKGQVESRENPEVLKQLKLQVMEIFKIYDFYGTNSIQTESVGHVLRMLGCVPLESEIVELIGLCENPMEKGKIRFDNFFKILFAWLLQGKMEPASEEELLDCLKRIDAGDGITEKRLKEVALECGEPMSDEQMKTMLATAVDRKTDKVIYDSFACKIYTKSPIYALARNVVTSETDDPP